MELIARRSEWRALLAAHRRAGARVGLVPTMGALHAGHLSLVEAARGACDVVAVTIFVNPLQFGDAADLTAYPRDLEADLEAAARAGVDAVFAPSAEEMYPAGPPETVVVPGPLASLLEGRSRPGHFEGVATVVTKLFSLAGACSAFFGEKDFQQLVVVRRIVGDLDLPVSVVGCPIVRDEDGLALSSRNRRLAAGERPAARLLYRSLEAGRRVLESGGTPERAEQEMWAVLATDDLVRPDYAAVVDPDSLRPPAGGTAGPVRLLVAAEVGPVRLIDNLAASLAPGGRPIT